VEEIRGKGLLRGIKLKIDPNPIQAAARERGLLVGVAGENCVRLAPPLIATGEDVATAIEILDQALSSVKVNA
jgi:acetylornithine/N-succinyldiaminopimelate aminotransferase